MTDKEKVMEMYKQAAKEAYSALEQTMGTEYGSFHRELFAEKYGRRQAYGRVLREIYGVEAHEIQKILDDMQK